ncbi:catenin (cadherin-associated protein), alpha 3 [Plakobranchus ocellatus]|uniref:Catenin (Cadherin-associated protein), alpha 3 n=1 Tax=Plakobranchus ocellatus TaxID=259542 RepID=A0AAV4ALQ4_9GAST|nr:catenin (cadherin-associated protein), alpha 3 [Plakobranchus ocellatus]
MDVEENVLHAIAGEEIIKDDAYLGFRVLVKSRQKKDEIIHYTLLLMEMFKQVELPDANEFMVRETQKCKKKHLKDLFIRHKGVKVSGNNINNLRYADDTVLIADSEEKLQNILTTATIESENKGLQLNAKKTECMDEDDDDDDDDDEEEEEEEEEEEKEEEEEEEKKEELFNDFERRNIVTNFPMVKGNAEFISTLQERYTLQDLTYNPEIRVSFTLSHPNSARWLASPRSNCCCHMVGRRDACTEKPINGTMDLQKVAF